MQLVCRSVRQPRVILLHWAVPVSTIANPFRFKERVITTLVAPALKLPKVKSACRQFYASKQPTEVWLNLFVAPGDEHHVISAVRPLAKAFGVPDPKPDSTDDILSRDYTRYRKLLTNATRYAIDLHLQPNLVAEQQALICIACRTSDPRDELKAHLQTRSPNYRADGACAKKRFWSTFLLPGPRSNFSHPGHWIWNIVLGKDYGSFPWPSAASVAQSIGIPTPVC